MPHIVLFHGYAESPDSIWFPYIREALEPLGHVVTYQKLPHPLKPRLQAWISAATPLTAAWDERTIVVGHSLGGLLALRLLERQATPRIHALITVSSPFDQVATTCTSLEEFLEGGLNGDLLRRQADRFVIMHAEDDEVVPLDHAFRYASLLNGEFRCYGQGGHFIELEEPDVLKVIKEVLTDFA